MKIFYLDYIQVYDFKIEAKVMKLVGSKALLTKLDSVAVLNSGLRANYPYHGIHRI